MKCVLFVPGTMGSILSTPGGEEVWPPTPIPMLKLRLPPAGTPGFYRARFVGKPPASKPVQFAVTAK